MSSRPTRRQMLAGTTAGAVAAMSGQFARVVEKAYAATPTKDAPLSDVEHVIFLMMENRSFDHYFGTYPGVRGFDDPKAIPGVFRQRGYRPGHGPDKNGYLRPFHLNTKDLASVAECVDDITHDWQPQHQSWNGGKMDRWVVAHLEHDTRSPGPITMGYYKQEDIPTFWALADAFTLCDEYYCSLLGPTDPNRLMWLTGTIDPEGKHGGPCLTTRVSDRALQFGKFTWETMPERLLEAGVSWQIYQDVTDTTLLNPLLYFKNFLTNPQLAARNDTGIASYPAKFARDVALDRLPQVSWIFPPFVECDHPSAPPILGEQLVASVLNTVVSKPGLWEKTAIIVSYDENGGFFDHVPPPTPPHGTPGEHLTVHPLPATADGVRGPVGLGFRVPGLILSPYARGGFVASKVFDHTSQLLFLEKRFGVDAPNLSKWRRTTVGDLTSAFSFGRRPHDGVPTMPGLTTEQIRILAGECTITGGVLGVEDLGAKTPIPGHIPPPRQRKGKPRRPIHLHNAQQKPSNTASRGSAAQHHPPPATTTPPGSSEAAGGNVLPNTGAPNDLPIVAATMTAAALALLKLRHRRDDPD